MCMYLNLVGALYLNLMYTSVATRKNTFCFRLNLLHASSLLPPAFTVPDYGPPPPRSPLSRYLNTNATAAANEKCSRKPSGRDRTRHPTDRRTDATRRPRKILQPPTFLRSSKQADARRATGRTWDSYPSSGGKYHFKIITPG